MNPQILEGSNLRYKRRAMGRRYDVSIDFIPIEKPKNGFQKVIISKVSGLADDIYQEGVIFNIELNRQKFRFSRNHDTSKFNKWIQFAKLMVM
jgi:hypothetical protein